MARTRSVLGLLAGALLLLSAAAHSLAGWPALQAQLAAAQVPADLQFGLKAGWQFGGVAMLVFGLVVVAVFAKRWRGEAASLLAPRLIAAAYLAFGGWALVASGFDPFFWVFVVPAVLLIAATAGGGSGA